MKTLRNSSIVFVILLIAVGSQAAASSGPLDEFGDINCEDEMARLDNFAVQLQNAPESKGAIVFYAGKMTGGRLPKRGEAEARVARLKSYLTKRRGIPANRIVVIDGRYDESFRVQLWMVPSGAALPKPAPASPVKQIRFRKGKLNPRDYRCEI